jgi:hypothetical protein
MPELNDPVLGIHWILDSHEPVSTPYILMFVVAENLPSISYSDIMGHRIV